MEVESFRVMVRDRGVSHVGTIEMSQAFIESWRVKEDDESPLRVTCVTSLVTRFVLGSRDQPYLGACI
jgi:hypothetical protein